MPEHFKRRYGLDFPHQLPDPMIELMCCKKYREEPYKHGNLLHPGEHWLRGVQGLFTPEQLTISRWTREFAEAWGVEDSIVIWGCAASEKSHLAALGLLTSWVVDPQDTICLLASTTRDMLRMRSWSSVVQLFGMLKAHPQYIFPGKESRTSMAIINETEEETESGAHARSVKASIRGMAVNEGSSLRGAHGKYLILCLDEVNLMRQETYDERINLSVGCTRFRMISLCNPSSFTDLAGRISVPIDGWNSVDSETPSWRTKEGTLVIHRSGYMSPAVLEPNGAELYPHIINQAAIDRIARETGSEQSLGMWSMVLAFPPPSGTQATVLTETELNVYEAQAPAVWAAGETPVKIAALDAAFTSPEDGGDGCVLQFASVGRITPGLPAIVFEPPHYLIISASSKVPVTAQIVGQVRELLAENNVPVSRLGCDDSGLQGLGDAIETALGLGVIRFNYANKATDALTLGGRERYEERYANLITELWILMASFIRCRNVRNLGNEASRQLTMRRLLRRTKVGKVGLELKKEFKKRTGGASPDEMDSAAMVAGVARAVLGFHPGKAPEQFSAPSFSPPSLSRGKGGIKVSLKSSYGSTKGPKGYLGRV